MTDEKKARPRVERYEDLLFLPRAEKGDMAQLAQISGVEDGTALGTGLVRLTKAHIEWTVKYDEVLIVLEDLLRVHAEGRVLEAGPRDSIWLPAGTALVYEAEDALVAYAIHPADWAAQGAA